MEWEGGVAAGRRTPRAPLRARPQRMRTQKRWSQASARSATSMSRPVWYRDKDRLQIGGVSRYTVRYEGVGNACGELYLRLKNIERLSIRAIHLLNGPFILYCHVVPCNYTHQRRFTPQRPQPNGPQQLLALPLRLPLLALIATAPAPKGRFDDLNEVEFRNEIKPGQTFNVPLRLNHNLLRRRLEDGRCQYEWLVDVVLQIVVTTYTYIHYDLMVGDDFKAMKRINHGLNAVTALTALGELMSPQNSGLHLHMVELPLNQSMNPALKVTKQSGDELWSTPPKDLKAPVHLVIVTHGIFANVSADMLYLKDSLEAKLGQNVIVRGYMGNAGHSERGVKKLGIRVADYVIALVESVEETKEFVINKISFVGHLLGGLVQLYAIKYILTVRDLTFFSLRNIEPDHLICMASPLLGVLNEMSFIISWFLDIGALGKTGRDLTLLKKIPTLKDFRMNSKHGESDAAHHRHVHDNFKPLLEVLPNEPLQGFLRKFNHLTLYANAVNDGIVPLRTASLLYLDWEALGDVGGIQEKERKGEDRPQDTKDPQSRSCASSGHGSIKTVRSTAQDSIGEVPDDTGLSKPSGADEVKTQLHRYKEFFSLNLKRKSRAKLNRKFMLINAKGYDPDMVKGGEESDDDDDTQGANDDEEVENEPNEDNDADYPLLNIPPKASAVELALHTLICPVPSNTYIDDPETRPDVIFHDKYYNFKSMPAEKSINLRRNRIGRFIFKYYDHKVEKQVKIARKYHDGITWRKVLVHLPPDAHNNIVVRRRFSNGYGWGVVDHVVGLFQEPKPKM